MVFEPIDKAPKDGTEVLARWTATEHGHRYAVVYWATAEDDWFCGDIPVRGMDSFCYLPK